jgi:hypothetical protein
VPRLESFALLLLNAAAGQVLVGRNILELTASPPLLARGS